MKVGLSKKLPGYGILKTTLLRKNPFRLLLKPEGKKMRSVRCDNAHRPSQPSWPLTAICQLSALPVIIEL